MDNLTKDERSWVMSRVKQRHTGPEVAVRSILWRLGYRYRLHAVDIAGQPDIVFRSRQKLIFIHGCFWHRHKCRQGQRTPKSRVKFWTAKFERNEVRDAKTRRLLIKNGWKVLVVWECELRNVERLMRRLRRFLEA
jgi:DNA mismatch endonuclease, patch repair protein